MAKVSTAYGAGAAGMRSAGLLWTQFTLAGHSPAELSATISLFGHNDLDIVAQLVPYVQPLCVDKAQEAFVKHVSNGMMAQFDSWGWGAYAFPEASQARIHLLET